MAYKNLITYASKLNKVIQDYYSPNVLINGNKLTSIYGFISKVDPWTDDNSPDEPSQSQQYIKSVFANMIVAKQITSNDIYPVIQRIDWVSGKIYDYYQDDIDMFEVDGNGLLVNKFYVKNSYDQVFKCLWNNNGNLTTDMPMFQPGVYGTNQIYTGTDGYKWKFMYSIDLGLKKKFMNAVWMPVIIGSINSPNPDPNNSTVSAGIGDVEVINVTNGGSGYDPSNTIIQVNVTGANTIQATGNVSVSNGSITDIYVTNSGKNYTSANVSINVISTSNLVSIGTGATAIAPVSPIGGHGYDPRAELGANHVMFSLEFKQDENGNLPTDIEYYQVGLLVSPISTDSSPNPANSSIYSTTVNISVSSGYGNYTNDEIVYQGTNLQTSTFSGEVLSFDSANNILKLINTKGSAKTSSPLYGNSSTTSRTLLSTTTPNLIPYSGYISYIENRSGIQRSSDGIEQFRFVVQY
jgi:hypothetical protein